MSNLKNSPLLEKSKDFAKRIVFLAKDLRGAKKEIVLSNQLLKSGTSIGANVHEAQYAQSKEDFKSKLKIALKECYESEYWLELLFETDYISEQEYQKLKNDCGAIRRMLISSINTLESQK